VRGTTGGHLDALEQYLRSESSRPRVDADQLRALGHKAAAQFTEKQVPLGTSIPTLAKEAGLNDEQTRRVIEFANNTVFSTMFKSGFTQNITFPLGDPAQILSKREAPVEKTKHASAAPSHGRYVPGQELVSLESAFEAGLHKTASAGPDVRALTLKWLDKVAEIRSHKTDLDSTANAFMLCLSNLDVLVKQASTEGHPPYVLGACISRGNPGTNLSHFLQEHYGALVDIPDGIQKVAEAGMDVAPENPVTDATQQLEVLQQQLMATQEAVTQAQQLVDQMMQTMKAPINENPADQLFQAQAPPQPPPEQAPPQQQQMQPGQEGAPLQPAVA
jgi:hypothetical protein